MEQDGPRRADIDWLRIAATYLLFVFHGAKTFDAAPYYHIKNDALSPGLDLLTGFIHQWHMPLLFMLAGWSILPSLRRRGALGFARERLARLFVPLVFGCLVLCPAIRYIELARQTVDPQDGFEFLRCYFTSLECFSWCHLWFLVYLLCFSLLYLPLLWPLARWQRRFELTRMRTIYWPLLPLILIQIGLRWRWPGWQNLIDDWANFAYYSVFVLLGFSLARSAGFTEAVRQRWGRLLGLGLLGEAGLLIAWRFKPEVPQPYAYIIYETLTALAGWGMAAGLFGLAGRLRLKAGRVQEYLSQSALPVYVLHQFWIVLLGALIVLPLHLGIWPKLALLIGSALAATLLNYELIRRNGLLRALHGTRR